ncbi:hypothetical protein [Brevifollis gellanilyticus]|nr:hypothetical protein [Brevifollis gellanilyticus]
MSAVSSPPLNAAASPFGAPMFKVAPGENATGAGVIQTSPFAAAGASAGTNAPLTVGDVLPQLPPEIARHGALPPDQPVAISSQTIDEALRSGQAAVPMFEIYRVCPALFQTPVSPQDPRMIPLPASKLPRLIAAAQSGGAVGMAPPMPMMASAPPMSASPFAMAAQPPGGGMMMETSQPPPLPGTTTPSGMLLPPKRQGPPPPLAEVGSRDVSPQISLPGASFPMSPFAPAGAEPQAPLAPAGQPFGMAPGMGGSPFGAAPGSGLSSPFMTRPETPSEPAQAPAAAAASPFAPSGMAPASPFSAPQAPAAPLGAPSSPFSASPPPLPAAPPASSSPFGAVAPAQGSGVMVGASPFGSLFGDKAVPTGQPAPDAPGAGPRMVGSSPMAMPQAPGPMAPASSGSAPVSGPVRISLAGMLKGYTAAELGFDPMVVPAWITTSMPASAVKELLGTPTPLAQLGFLVDGITDIGFRNVLNTARRDFQIRVDPELLQTAIAGSNAPPTLPNLSGLGPSAPSPAPQAGPGPVMMVAAPSSGAPGSLQTSVMRVEPPPGFAPPSQPGAPASPFGAPAPSADVMTPSFTAPAAPLAEGFGAPAGAGSPFASAQPVPPAFSMPAAGSPFQTPAAPPGLQPPAAPTSLQAAFAPPPFAPAPAVAPPQPQAQPQFAAFPGTPAAPPQDPFAAPLPSGVPLFQPAAQAAFSPPAAPAYQAPALPTAPFASPPSAPFAGAQPPAAGASLAPPPMFLETTVLPPEPKPGPPSGFQTFRPPASDPTENGFSSDQLLGQIQPPHLERSWSHAAAAAASGPLSPAAALERSAAPVIDIPATPAAFFDPAPPEATPPPVRAFVPPAFEESAPPFQPPAAFPAPAPTTMPAARPASRPAANAGFAAQTSLGVQTHDVNPDQIMLRALLDTDCDLTPQRVVELACGLPGIAACVCLREGGTAISHAGAHKPQAREFQKQASQLAQHLRALAPLIGIDGAETFTMNSGDRLMTFCFPEGAILGVLHDAEPTLGLRDKITLIARELSRMIV